VTTGKTNRNKSILRFCFLHILNIIALYKCFIMARLATTTPECSGAVVVKVRSADLKGSAISSQEKVRIRDYFSKPEEIREQNSFGNTTLDHAQTNSKQVRHVRKCNIVAKSRNCCYSGNTTMSFVC
jgi:hypothetical protein